MLSMLEYKFTELDDDFITLWSNFILYHDTSLIIGPLKEIAEKGQINAIQCWYLLKKVDEESQIIDSIVDSYYGDSFNESLAIANRIHDKTRHELKELLEQIAHYHELGVRKYEADLADQGIEQTNDYFKKRNDLINEYKLRRWLEDIKEILVNFSMIEKSDSPVLRMQILSQLYKLTSFLIDYFNVNADCTEY